MPTSFEPENVVLNLHHLGFGFQICLIFAYVAFVTFLAEIVYFWMRNVYESYEYGREKKGKNKIIMVLSAKSFKGLQMKPKSGPIENIKKLARMSSLEDEYSSDDSNASKESVLRRAFGRRVVASSRVDLHH